MLTLRRKPMSPTGDMSKAAIDFILEGEEVELVLESVKQTGAARGEIQIWSVTATSWSGELYHPEKISLMRNQSYRINSWLKIYGAHIKDGEGVIHIEADDGAQIERRDRWN